MNREAILQIGIVVKDIKTAEEWARFLGARPVYGKTEPRSITGATYRGAPCDVRCQQAFFDLGNIQLELIAPCGEGASVWQEGLGKAQEGLHHLAFLTDDMGQAVAEMRQAGFSVLQQGRWQGARPGCYAYFDTAQQLKVTIEILQKG